MSITTNSYPLPDTFGEVRYQGSLQQLRGAVLSAEECLCENGCDRLRLQGEHGGEWVVVDHVRETSVAWS